MIVERLRVVDFNDHIALQVDMIQVVAFKARCPGDMLLETLAHSMIFPPLPRYKSIMRTYKWMSESVSESVSRPGVDETSIKNMSIVTIALTVWFRYVGRVFNDQYAAHLDKRWLESAQIQETF